MQNEMDAYIKMLRKKPMNKLSRAEATLLTKDSPHITVETNPPTPASGGRPREDEAGAIAAALRNEGKKWNEVSELLQQKTGEFRTADNCRKLVVSWQNRKKHR